MKGLDLGERLFCETRDELLCGMEGRLSSGYAAGLVGEGSECLGFDDEASRDHDWGPAYCVWLASDDYAECGKELQARYAQIEARGLEGLPPRPAQPAGVQRRTGVFSVDGFYAQLLRAPRLPETVAEWRAIPEFCLASATNGRVFCDDGTGFTKAREALLAYYPDDLRLKKIANGCMLAAQAGQYNFPRQAMRGEDVAAMCAIARFCEAAMQAVYAINRRFMPFYKWAHRGLAELDELGAATREGLDDALAAWSAKELREAASAIEGICELIAKRLAREGISGSSDAFLVTQAVEVNSRICDDALRESDLMRV